MYNRILRPAVVDDAKTASLATTCGSPAKLPQPACPWDDIASPRMFGQHRLQIVILIIREQLGNTLSEDARFYEFHR